MTERFFAQSDYRQRFWKKAKAYSASDSRGVPFKLPNGYYFYQLNPGKAQADLYYMANPDAQPQLFMDVNKLSKDGKTELETMKASKDGNFLAYSLSEGGSDWETIYVRSTDINKPNPIDHPIQGAKFGIFFWTPDNLGFFYVRYQVPVSNGPAGTETQQLGVGSLYYHFLGKPQTEDIAVRNVAVVDLDATTPADITSVYVTKDEKYVLLDKTDSMLRICDYQQWVKTPTRKILKCKSLDAGYNYITNIGPIFWLESRVGAPNRKVVKANLEEMEKGFVEVIPERKDLVLVRTFQVDMDKLLVLALKDVNTVMAVHDLNTGKELYKIPVPIGSSIATIPYYNEPIFFYSTTSYVTPPTIYKFDLKTQRQTEWHKRTLPGLRLDALETTQVFYESKDKTKVPMYVIHKKGLKLDGKNPTILYGYGGFKISFGPKFSAPVAAFIQHFNGIYAVASIRGGGEYGEEWHKAGKLKNKQNVFDDFQYAARFLITKGYTSAPKLAINGGSNGGLLVAACANQAPELFGAVVAEVGVMDMIRFPLFTAGRFWIPEFGNPAVKEDFELLMRYSPLHNIKKQQYPATLVMTADRDDRVVPLHSLKYLATLQAVNNKANIKPLLGKIAVKSGHGASSADVVLENDANRYGFIGMVLNATWVE